MTEPRDDELLVRLAKALEPADTPVPDAGLASLRAALDARDAGGLSRSGAGRFRRAVSTRWRRAGAAAALAGGLIIGGTGVAFAAGGHVPEPIRSFAYHIGLPVDSPGVSATHHDVKKLRDALKSTSEPVSTTTPQTTPSTTTGSMGLSSADSVRNAVRAANALAGQLSHISASDAKHLGATPWQLLAQMRRIERADGLTLTQMPHPSWFTPLPGHAHHHAAGTAPTSTANPTAPYSQPGTATPYPDPTGGYGHGHDGSRGNTSPTTEPPTTAYQNPEGTSRPTGGPSTMSPRHASSPTTQEPRRDDRTSTTTSRPTTRAAYSSYGTSDTAQAAPPYRSAHDGGGFSS